MLNVEALLQRYDRFGIRLGLERIEQLLAALENPQNQVPIVHVAGTNGKGSVCAYLSAVLAAAGYRVGRYISPHLVDWTERICINDQPISREDLLRSLQQVETAIQPDYAPSQFELITAAAWLYFAQQQVNIAVIEVGLGGRLDATNVCDRPLVSVITSISRDHWQRLGPTLGDIAGEKAGIIKPGCPVVVGPLPGEAETVVKHQITELGCPAVYPEPAMKQEKSDWVESQGIRYPLALVGSFQLVNSALAIAALLLLRQQGWQIADQAITTGMANTRWPGRLQWFTWQDHRLLLDGAHNPGAALELRRYVDSLPIQRVDWVMGMLGNKDHAEIFQALLRSGDQLFLVPIPGHLSAEPSELATLAETICPELANCQIASNVFTALEVALNVSDQNSLVVLCGSLYLLGEFFARCTKEQICQF